MELKRRTESELIGEITEVFADARAIMLVSYRGMTIEQDTRLRRLMRERGCKYLIYKSTILERALIETGHMNLAYYAGEPGIACIVGYDTSVAPEELVYQFNQPIPCVKVIAASIEGKCYDGATLQAMMDEKAERKKLGQRLTTDLHMPLVYLQNALIQLLKQKCEEEAIPYIEMANKGKIRASVVPEASAAAPVQEKEVQSTDTAPVYEGCEEEENNASDTDIETAYPFPEPDEIPEFAAEEEQDQGINENQRITEEAREKWRAYKSEQRWGMALVIVMILFAVALVIYTGYTTAFDMP